MLARIIEASSNPGDVAPDCFSGSGTTLNVASHHGRRWIGVDNSREAIAATLRRFGKGLEPMGDFVSKPASSSGSYADAEGILPLFGPDEFEKPTSKPRVKHRIIKNFSLLVQQPYQGELHDLIQQWTEWIGEPKDLRLSETPRPYTIQPAEKSAGQKLKARQIHRARTPHTSGGQHRHRSIVNDTPRPGKHP